MKTKVAQGEPPEAIVKPAPEQPGSPEPAVLPSSPSKKKTHTAKILGGVAAVTAFIAVMFYVNKNMENKGSSNTLETRVTTQDGNQLQTNNAMSESESRPEKTSADVESPPAKETETSVPVSAVDGPTPKQTSVEEKDVAVQTAKQASAPVEGKKSTENSATKPVVPTIGKSISGDVEDDARRVIHGDFGNGQERKDRLGASYSEIQAKVNELYRRGLVR